MELRNRRFRDDFWWNQTLPLTRHLSWPWLQKQQTGMLKTYGQRCHLQLIVCNIKRTVTIVETSTVLQIANSELLSAASVERKGTYIAHICRSKPFVQEPRPPCKLTPHATHVVTEDLLDYSMYNLTGT